MEVNKENFNRKKCRGLKSTVNIYIDRYKCVLRSLDKILKASEYLNPTPATILFPDKSPA